MSFVFPILLGGLALIGLPVLIHLILRQKPKTLPFPAFRFLLTRHKTNLRKLRLRHLLLLALRILIVGAICLALTRPRLTSHTLGLSRERPVAAVLLFDTSYSMEYKTSEGVTRLEEAKKRGLEVLSELPEGSRVAILDTAETLLATRGDGLMTTAQARERITNLKLQYVNAPVSKRLGQAYRLLADVSRAKEEGKLSQWPRVLFIFSDRTRGAWEGGDREAIWDAADFAAPLFEGLLQACSDIPTVLDLVKDLRTRVPAPAGRDYPDQSLREALDELANRLPGLTREYLPPEPTLEKMINDARRRTRALLAQVQAATGEDAYRGKLIGALQTLERDLAGVWALWIDVGVEQPLDVAITQVEFPTQYNGQPKQLFGAEDVFVVRTVVQATGKDVNTELTAQLGSKIYRQVVDVKAGQTATAPFEINVKELGLAPGAHQLEVRLATGDLLPFNNQRFATFAIRQPRKILILAEEKDKAYDFSYALKKGFAPEALTPEDALKQTIVDSQAIILFGLKEPSEALWDALRGYVEDVGGGLAVIPSDDDMKLKAYNEGLAQALLPGQFGNIMVEKEGVTWNFEEESIYQHPLLNPFRAWKTQSPRVDIFAYPRHATQFWEVKSKTKDAAVLVSYADKGKSPAILERRFEKGRGKVLLFTTPLEVLKKPWNNYLESDASFYLVLANLMTRYLAGDEEAAKLNFLVGREPARLALSLSDRLASYTLRGPELLVQIGSQDQGGQLVIPQAAAPGNYSLEGLRGETTKRIGAFSVNMPAEESDLTRVPVEDLETVLGKDVVVPLDRKSPLKDGLAGHWQEPVDLFPFVMVLLLVILAVENLVSNKFYRRETS